MTEQSDFVELAKAALAATTARPRLTETQEAVVLERIARGAGATRWYVLRGPNDLDALATRLRPGSRVSLYFDSRFLIGVFGDDAREAAGAIIERDGEVVVGALRPHDIEAETDFPSSIEEADEFAREHGAVLMGALIKPREATAGEATCQPRPLRLRPARRARPDPPSRYLFTD